MGLIWRLAELIYLKVGDPVSIMEKSGDHPLFISRHLMEQLRPVLHTEAGMKLHLIYVMLDFPFEEESHELGHCPYKSLHGAPKLHDM